MDELTKIKRQLALKNMTQGKKDAQAARLVVIMGLFGAGVGVCIGIAIMWIKSH